jgi:chloride channel protein, CIC family
VALRAGRIRPRVVAAKLVASGVCIGTGGSVGREGPIVQIGSALGSSMGQWLGIDRDRLRTLVGCGAAAGIAATFNAPVAGALFAVEIILGDFGVAQFSPIVISSVAATVVSHRFLGNFPAFVVPPYRLVHASELFAYAALGLVAGVVALAFIRALYGLEDAFDGFQWPLPFKTVVGGLLIGVMGAWAPQIFGVGYEAINQALTGQLVLPFMLALVGLKILAVSVTIGSGGSGGIFAPSLFIGAMLGGAAGTLVGAIWPAATGGVGAYAMVGMGAVVAGATHAPITAILIIFELTGDYAIILPLMISCIIATLIATRLERASIYTLKLIRRGVDIHRGRAINVLQHVHVKEVMRDDMVTVAPETGVLDLVTAFLDQPTSTLFVTDENRRLLGVVTAEHLRSVMQNPSAFDGLVIAEDLMAHDSYPCVSPEGSLAEVIRTLEGHRGEVPVVRDECLVGIIWPEDVIERYNTETFKRDMAGSMVSAVEGHRVERVPGTRPTVVAEVPVPRPFVGRTIGELNVRQRYAVSILMVRHVVDGRDELQPVGADYRFAEGDALVVLGPTKQVRLLERGILGGVTRST